MSSLGTVATAGAKQVGPRFNIVNVLPSGLLVLFVLGILSTGAPLASSPRLDRLSHALDHPATALVYLVLWGITVVVLAFILQPFQFAFVRVMEGYWGIGLVRGTATDI